MASQAETAVPLAGTRSELHAVVTELSGSGLLSLAVLLLHRWIDRVVVEAGAVAVAIGVLMVLLGADLTPIVTFVRIGREELSPDRGAARVLAQLAGAAIAGCLVGWIIDVSAPASAVLDIATLREATLALCVVLAALTASRRHLLVVLPVLAAVACVLGSSWLGNPLLVLASAFGSLATGTVAQIGPLLLSLTVAPLVGGLAVFAVRGRGRSD